MIHFVDIDESNWRTPLAVADTQKAYVAERAVILARAYAYRNARSRAFLIYNDCTPVGMGLYYDLDDSYDLSQLFIDERYQGKGYGRAAIGLILDMLRADRKYETVKLCYIDGNDAARKLYEGFGFVETERDEDEIVMELKL